MANVKLRIIVATAIIFLLSLLLILWLVLQRSHAFFVTGSLDAVFIFAILVWSVVRHALLGPPNRCIEVAAAALALAVLLTVAVLSCLRRCSATFYVTASLDAAVAVAFISWVVARRVKALRRKRGEPEQVESEEEEVHLAHTFYREVIGLPRRFRYEELKAATEDFRTPIGRGGSGSVFKGFLGDDLPIAVKRIEGEVRGEKEFRTEITAILSVQHINLVRIIGYCLVAKSHRFLVYEFYENGSLDGWIFPRSGQERCLAWALRYQVAIDVAKALAYLHHDCRVRILHLDVKPENILLDRSFRAHVSDFGISRLMQGDESKVVTTLRGTIGYLAPEWFLGIGISDKSDVYSYGMVLLELVGGRRNARASDHGNFSEPRWSYFPKNASEKMREGRLMEAVDERMLPEGGGGGSGGVKEEELIKLVYIALWCIQEKPELRPSMALVVNMLEGHVAVSMPPETNMFLVDLTPTGELEAPSGPGVAQSSTSGEDTQHIVTVSTP
ncbi:hypothetical protein B296_00004744 [Ensete ventricosum]|uniref:Protein kinase domain-containing protein n=1 Tax=Ensete ventricosum TaxID=4639 RepID=A0A426Z4E3_ENSVE|nr:hypothetical protein B296_00004744 [Ensete ventricosum]